MFCVNGLVTPDEGVPPEVFNDASAPGVAQLPAQIFIAAEERKRIGNGRGVTRGYENCSIANNSLTPAIMGGDDRQTCSHCL